MKELDFEEMYRLYSDKIFRFFMWRTGDVYLAEDLTSETFTRAWQKWPTFDGKYQQAWLYRIGRNLLIDHWRKKRDVLLAEHVADPEAIASYDRSVVDRLAEDQAFQELSAAVRELPEPLQTIVILRFSEDYSAAEVAHVLETTEGNIRVLQFRALQKLRTILQKKGLDTP